ncbi:MAG TPA: phosphoenolpyruvate carboxykinase (ATP) [Longimicrobiales bacterium]|nr:phosphoenolpyruvate carboxykinase (ATP) [Longimicrobiales bacterium]
MATETASADLSRHGIRATGEVHRNLSPAVLIEHAVRRGEGNLTSGGAFVGRTVPHTGRSPDDKFVVREPTTESKIWWGKVNTALDADRFEVLANDVRQHLAEQALYVSDLWAGADEAYRLNVRFVSPSAWHSVFVNNMFLVPPADARQDFDPGFTVLHAPEFEADPARHGCRSSTVIALDFGQRMVIIAGTRYAGELKKSIFTVMNYLMPQQGVLPMHCSANVGADGDVALFFGLSGTGKTTLSADPERGLIGDDEHGWTESGVFNFEGGNYAKVIRLSPEGEPLIHAASTRFGAILENVTMDDETRGVDFDDDSTTENTRSSYPITFIPGHVESGQAGHPKNVVFLTADAFGVMPPISRLTPEQAMYHFLSGYTAKLAGTERGVTEPKAAFSACFGAPFLPLPPSVYAEMLGRKLEEHGAQVWLVNTGWTGGGFGTGRRMKLSYTRAMVRAALAGDLADVETEPDPVFGLHIPKSVPGVPDEVLQPRSTWADPAAYDEAAAKLAGMFRENFEKFAASVSEGVRGAGPKAQ